MSPTHAVVLDFDGTLTRYGTYLVDVVNSRVDGPLHDALVKVDAYYRPRALSHVITPDEEYTWGLRTFETYITHGLRISQIRRVLKDIKLRPGVPDFLNRLHDNGVPHAIVSYGFKPFITIVLENCGVDPERMPVFAAEFDFDRRGRMRGYDESTYVLPEMKGVVSRMFADSQNIPHQGLIGVGDSSGDRRLGHLKKKRLGICESRDQVGELLPYFGSVLVLPDGHFDRAERWIERRLSSPR